VLTSGHLFLLLGLLSFGVLGIFHKLADVKAAEPKALTAVLYVSSFLLALISSLVMKSGNPIGSQAVILTALPFGISAGIAILAFQAGIRHGDITTSWLVINLSSAIPTIMSVFLYNERVTRTKEIALLLIPIAIGLLWKERVASNRKVEAP
jgi:drug/metabolite transporter (DMT)-like permease